MRRFAVGPVRPDSPVVAVVIVAVVVILSVRPVVRPVVVARPLSSVRPEFCFVMWFALGLLCVCVRDRFSCLVSPALFVSLRPRSVFVCSVPLGFVCNENHKPIQMKFANRPQFWLRVPVFLICLRHYVFGQSAGSRYCHPLAFRHVSPSPRWLAPE